MMSVLLDLLILLILAFCVWRGMRRGLILTCKDRLIGFYEGFGYKSLGVSQSVHGGAVWYDMILEFSE